MFYSITGASLFISENSNSVFIPIIKGDLDNFPNLAQAFHRLSQIPITRVTSTVTYGRCCHWYCQKSKQIFFFFFKA